MGSPSFGGKVELQGESAYRKALNTITNDLKVLTSEMKTVTTQYDKNDTSVENLTKQNKVLNEQIEQQKEKVDILKKALSDAETETGENSDTTKKWQIELNNAQSTLNTMERKLENNNKTLNEASKEFDEAEENVNDFGNELDDASKKSEQAHNSFEKLNSVCKTAGKVIAGAFTAVSGAAVAAGKALIDMSVAGSNYADDVLTTSAQTGIATDKLQEYMYAAELVDVSTETLTKSMAKQIKSMKAVQDGTKLSVEAYEKLGVSVTTSDGSLRDSDTVYWEVIDKLGKMKNETERDAVAMQILGKSAQELNPLIEAGAGRMKELGEKAKETGYVLGEKALNDYGKFNDNIQYLKVNAEGAKNALGTVLLPVLTELSGTGSELLGEFTKGITAANGDIGKMSEVISSVLPKALDSVMEYVPELLEVVGSILTSIGGAVTENLPQIVDSVSGISISFLEGISASLPQIADGALQLVLALTEGLIKNLPMLADTAVQVILSLVDGIGASLPELIPAAVSAILTLVDGLLGNLPLIIDSALQLILALAQGIGAALPEITAAVPQILSTIVTAITASLPLLLPATIDIIFALVDGLLASLPELVACTPNLIMGIVQGILDNLPTLILYMPDVITAIITGIIGAIPQLVAALPQVISSIVNTFKSYDWGSVGKNLMDGLTKGISDMKEKIKAKIKEIGKSIKDTFTDFFGIHSPSTVFAGFGKNLLEGLWNGIKNVKDWLVGKIRSLGSTITNALKTVLGIHSPSTVFRDEIGANLALGVGEGFSDTMKHVSNKMANSIPTDFDTSVNVIGKAQTSNMSQSMNFERFVLSVIEALKNVKIEMNDREFGSFVEDTVRKAVYA